MSKNKMTLIFFFLIAFPLSPLRAYQVPCGRLFSSLFSYVVRRGSGVLSPATHAHPLFSFLLFLDATTRIQTQTSMGGPSGLGFEPC
jgi:hypothetical protein